MLYNSFVFVIESEAENQISLKTSQMENESLKAKVKSLEETMGRFREEISKTFNNLSWWFFMKKNVITSYLII
jgi:hypothetical protein